MEMSLPPAVLDIAAAHSGHAKAALVVTPHPFTLQDQRVLDSRAALFDPGESLLDLLARNGVEPGNQWVVSIEGHSVPEAMWSRTWPVDGFLIEARRVPEKDALRLVAMAALSYFTMGAGGLGAGGLFATGGAIGGGWIAAAGTFVAGSFVLNKMLAPKGAANRSEQSASPTYSLTGGRNRMRLYEPMGLVLGEPYAVPDLAAQPYTFFANGEQYLWQMFHLGINCADFTTMRIGQTALDSYQGVTVLRNGLASNNSDFPALGTSVDSVAGAVVSYTGGEVVRTSSANTVRLAIDLVYSLFAVNQDGSLYGLTLDVLAEYRPVGGGAWLPFTPFVPAVPAVTETRYWEISDDVGSSRLPYTHVITPGVAEVPAGYIRQVGATQKPIRVTVEAAVAPGQYEVRLRKLMADEDWTGAANAVEWVQLKSYQLDTATYDGQARLGVRIQASGQLNGALDEFNGQARAKPMPYWNGSAWVTATDRASGLCNNGAIFLLLCRGIRDSGGRLLAGLGYSDDQIDIAGLQQFMVHCKENDFTFDLNWQSTGNVEELLSTVAYGGMGEVSWVDGKIGVSFYRRDDPLTGVINMGSIKAGTFEVDYATMPTADELEAQYFDRERGDTWQPVRVQAPGTTPLREPARINLVGVTTEAHAAKLARFAMAQNIYQRKTISCEQDLEYMTHKKGSVVALSHDLTQWGYSGRLQAFQDVGGVITLTLDDIAPGALPPGTSTRYIGLQLPGEQQMRVFPVASFVGESRTVTLSVPWPSGVTKPGNLPSNPPRDTKWIYDFKAVPGQLLRMVSIEPSANGARETMVEESAEFWDYVESGTYQPPPNNSRLRAAPVVTRAFPIEELARQGNTFYTALSLNFEVDGPFSLAELWGATGPGDVSPAPSLLATSRSQTLEWRGGLDERWHLELRVYSDTRAGTPYRLIYDVRGLREPPPNVESLSVSGDTLSWPGVSVPDLAGYLLRFQYGNNPWWNTATPLHEGVITESPYPLSRRPQGLVTLLIKAVDTTGNESTDAAWIVYNFPELPIDNILLDYPQHPTFSGDFTGGTVVGGELLASATDRFWEPDGAPFWTPSTEPFWATSQYGTLVYEFEVQPEEVGTLVLQHEIDGDGLLIEYQVTGSEPFWDPSGDPFWEPPEALFWGTPSSWSVWPGSLMFDGLGRIRFRVTVAPGVSQGAIRELTAVLDVPDVTELLENVAIAPGGTRLAITKTYSAIRTVRLTLHGGGTGISTRLLDKDPALGPLVEILNSSGVSVAGVLDAEPQGY